MAFRRAFRDMKKGRPVGRPRLSIGYYRLVHRGEHRHALVAEVDVDIGVASEARHSTTETAAEAAHSTLHHLHHLHHHHHLATATHSAHTGIAATGIAAAREAATGVTAAGEAHAAAGAGSESVARGHSTSVRAVVMTVIVSGTVVVHLVGSGLVAHQSADGGTHSATQDWHSHEHSESGSHQSAQGGAAATSGIPEDLLGLAHGLFGESADLAAQPGACCSTDAGTRDGGERVQAAGYKANRSTDHAAYNFSESSKKSHFIFLR